MAKILGLNICVQEYGLTLAELQVASALIQGETVASIAKKRRVSVTTVRTQVRAIFHKTNVTRQADLIRLLLGGEGDD